MKKYCFLLISLLSLTWLHSCKDNTDANLPDTQVYIVNSDPAKNSFNLYTTGIKDTCVVSIYRSGKYGKEVTASVRIMTADELSAYNVENETDYSLMPSNCFTVLSSTVSFTDADDDVLRQIPVSYDPSLIVELQNENPTLSYVVPFIIESSNVAISTSLNVAFIKTQVYEPLIYLGMSGFTEFSYDVDKEVASLTQLIPINVDFKNYWNINCSVSSTSQAFIDTYNTNNGTTFSLMPASAYTLENNVLLASGKKAADINLAIDGTKVPYGKTILPIELTGVSKFSVSPTANTYYYSFNRTAPTLERTDWKIAYCNSWEPTATAVAAVGVGVPENILDGDVTTCWFKRFSANGTPDNPSSPVPPYVIIVDMGKAYSLTEISLTHGQTATGGFYSYLQGGEFSLSNDDIPTLVSNGTLETANWSQIGTFTMKSTAAAQPFSTFNNVKGRYLKINMSNVKSNYAFVAELTARGTLD